MYSSMTKDIFPLIHTFIFCKVIVASRISKFPALLFLWDQANQFFHSDFCLFSPHLPSASLLACHCLTSPHGLCPAVPSPVANMGQLCQRPLSIQTANRGLGRERKGLPSLQWVRSSPGHSWVLSSEDLFSEGAILVPKLHQKEEQKTTQDKKQVLWDLWEKNFLCRLGLTGTMQYFPNGL